MAEEVPASGARPGTALAVLLGALVVAAAGARLPIATCLAAAWAGAALARRFAPAGASRLRRAAAVVVPLLGAALSEAAPGDDLREALFLLTWAAVAAGAAVAVSSASRRGGGAPATRLVAALQRSPWRATAALATLGVADVLLGVTAADRSDRTLASVVLCAVVPGVVVHLTFGTRDAVGRLAPLALGTPSGALGAAVAYTMARGGPLQAATGAGVLTAGAAMTLWSVAASYALASARRPWLAFAGAGAGAVTAALVAEDPSIAAWTAVAPLAVFALSRAPLSAGRLTQLAALVGASTAAVVVVAWPAAVRDGFLGGRFVGLPASVAYVVRGAEWAAVLAALGALCRRARSMTAVPADHPVFTEAPYVLREREARAAVA